MDAADAEALVRGAARLGVELDGAAVDRLGRFVELLDVWNRRFRLTGDRDPAVIVRKHVLDSLALAGHVPAPGPLLDLGSGAGFPGLPVACARPDVDVVLVESRRRPASFLAEAVRTLGLATRVVEARAEEAASEPALAQRMRIVTARAIRVDLLLGLARPFLAPDGAAVAMQTAEMSSRAVATAARAGFRHFRTVDYRLAAGEPRCLLFFSLVC